MRSIPMLNKFKEIEKMSLEIYEEICKIQNHPMEQAEAEFLKVSRLIDDLQSFKDELNYKIHVQPETYATMKAWDKFLNELCEGDL